MTRKRFFPVGSIWQDRKLRTVSEPARMLALYLLTNDHRSLEGYDPWRPEYAAVDLQWPEMSIGFGTAGKLVDPITGEWIGTGTGHADANATTDRDRALALARSSDPLAELVYAGFCRVDHDREVILIRKALAWHKGRAPNNLTRAVAHLDEHRELRESPLLAEFIDIARREWPALADRLTGAPASPAAVVVDDDPQATDDAPPTDDAPATDVAREVFEYWRTVHNHPRAKLDAKRRKLVARRLAEGYTPADLMAAIDGCKLSPHHQGTNDRGTVYDDFGLILRDAAHVDQFIGYTTRQPAPKGRATRADRHASTIDTVTEAIAAATTAGELAP